MPRKRAKERVNDEWRPEEPLAELERALAHKRRLLNNPKRQRRLRITARRLEAVLWAFRDRLPPGSVRTIERALRKLRQVAGAARDVEIARERAIPILRRDAAALRAYERASDRASRKAGRALERRVSDERSEVLELAEQLADAAGVVPGSLAARYAPRQAITGCVARLREALTEDLNLPDNLHRARRRLKELRYAIEVLSPLLDSAPTLLAADSLRSRLARYQTSLGAFADLRLLAESLSGAAQRAPRPAATTLRTAAARIETLMHARCRTLARALRSPRFASIVNAAARLSA